MVRVKQLVQHDRLLRRKMRVDFDSAFARKMIPRARANDHALRAEEREDVRVHAAIRDDVELMLDRGTRIRVAFDRTRVDRETPIEQNTARRGRGGSRRRHDRRCGSRRHLGGGRLRKRGACDDGDGKNPMHGALCTARTRGLPASGSIAAPGGETSDALIPQPPRERTRRASATIFAVPELRCTAGSLRSHARSVGGESVPPSRSSASTRDTRRRARSMREAFRT